MKLRIILQLSVFVIAWVAPLTTHVFASRSQATDDERSRSRPISRASKTRA